MSTERTCARCRLSFRGGTLLCPDCQQTALESIARLYPNDPEGTDADALAALSNNIKAIYDESEEDPDDDVL